MPDKQKIHELSKSGKSLRAIAKELSTSKSTVHRYLKSGKPSVQEEAAAINKVLSILPPGGGAPWTIPQAQQSIGLMQGMRKFYVSPDEAIRNSRENARTMFNNLVIREPLQARMLAVSELPWHIEPEDKQNKEQVKIANELQRICENIPDFLKLRHSLLYGVWFGRWAVQMNYVYKGKRLICQGWQPTHGDSLVYKWDSDDVGVYVGTYFGYAGTKKLDVEPADIALAHVLVDPDATYKDGQGNIVRRIGFNERAAFIIHMHESMPGDFHVPESQGGVKGLGVRSIVYWTWYILQNLFGWLVEFMERVGTGITFYKFLRNDEASYNAALSLAQSQSNQAAIMVPVDPNMAGGKPIEYVQRMEPSATPVDSLMRVLDDYLGAQIRRYIVGQDATSRSVSSGMNSGLADQHANTFNRIIRYDALNLQETLTHQLVKVLQKWNFPKTDFNCRFVIDVDRPDSESQLKAIKTAWDMGVSFSEDEVRSLTGCSAPDLGDNIISIKSQTPAPTVGMPNPSADSDGIEKN